MAAKNPVQVSSQKMANPYRMDSSRPSSSRRRYSLSPPLHGRFSARRGPNGVLYSSMEGSSSYNPDNPHALSYVNQAAYGVGEAQGATQEEQQFLRRPKPDFGEEAIRDRLRQRQEMLEPGYNWSGDEPTSAFRSTAISETNAARAKTADTMQAGATPEAIARETAKWDSQTRGDVMKYIAQRKLLAEQDVSNLTGRLAGAQQAQANYDLRRQQIARGIVNDTRRQRLEEEQRDVLSPYNLGRMAVSYATGGMAGAAPIATVLDSILGFDRGRDNEVVGTKETLREKFGGSQGYEPQIVNPRNYGGYS